MKINRDQVKGWLIASVFLLIFIVVPISSLLYFKTAWFRSFYDNYESIIWALAIICFVSLTIIYSGKNCTAEPYESTKINDEQKSDAFPFRTVRQPAGNGCSSAIGGCLMSLLYIAFAIAGLFVVIKIIKWIWYAV